MTSSFSQWTSFDDNTTTYDYQNDSTITDTITTEEFSTSTTVSTLLSNNSCYPNCYAIHLKPDRVNVDFIIGLACLLLIIVFVISTGVVVFLRHQKQSQKQQKKEKEFLKSEKLCAHPFEEVLVVVDEPQSIELMEMRPTTPAD